MHGMVFYRGGVPYIKENGLFRPASEEELASGNKPAPVDTDPEVGRRLKECRAKFTAEIRAFLEADSRVRIPFRVQGPEFSAMQSCERGDVCDLSDPRALRIGRHRIDWDKILQVKSQDPRPGFRHRIGLHIEPHIHHPRGHHFDSRTIDGHARIDLRLQLHDQGAPKIIPEGYWLSVDENEVRYDHLSNYYTPNRFSIDLLDIRHVPTPWYVPR